MQRPSTFAAKCRPFLWGAFVLALGAAGRAQDAALQADLGKLVSVRDGLLAALEKREAADAQKGPAQDYYLNLDEGADRNELQLTLRRRGGTWSTGYGEVMGWMPSTMQEWRSYFLGNGSGGAWRSILRFPTDATGIQLDTGIQSDGDRVSGEASVQFRLDQTLDEKLPPGSPISWWDRFVPSGLTQARKQSYTLDATVRKDAYLFELVLDGGVYWDGAWSMPKVDKKSKEVVSKPAGITRRPIVIRLQAPCTRFTVAKVQTPTWNGGYHEGDATGLKFENGKLTGVLLVMLHQDGWAPFGGGKTTRHDPLIVRFDVDAKLDHHEVTGGYKAVVSGEYKGLHYQHGGGESMKTEIPETHFDGTIRGRGGRAVLGRYQAKGDLGEATGAITGMLIDDPRAPRQIIGEEKLSGEGTELAGRVNNVLHQIRALHLANQCYPLPLGEALAQTNIAEPVWTGAEAKQVAAYVHEAARGVVAMDAPTEKLPASTPEGAGDSPSLGAAAMAVEGDVNVLPAQASSWLFARNWQVMGPFDQPSNLDGDGGLAPDVVPVAGVKYVQGTSRLGGLVDTSKALAWSEVTCDSPRLEMPGQSLGFYTRFVNQAWFGAAKVRSEQARKVWVSVEANDFAKLWVNSKLVWVDQEKPFRYRQRGRVVVPVMLEAGENQLLFRAHRDRRISWVRLAISLQEPANPTPAPTTSVANAFIYPNANPPLAWDIDKGINVAWRQTALGGNVRPVPAGDALLVTVHPYGLHCLDAATGKERWAVDVNVPEALDPKDVAAWQQLPEGKERNGIVKVLQGKGLAISSVNDLRIFEPVVDGQTIYAHGGGGVVGAYDMNGKAKWVRRTNLLRARVHVYKGLVVVHGLASSGWPEGKGADPKSKQKPVGVLILDAATGEPRQQLTLTGSYHESMSNLVVLRNGEKEAGVLLCGAETMVDIASGRVLPPVDLDLPPGAGSPGGAAGYGASKACGYSANSDTVFWTIEEQSVAARLWLTADGRVGYGHRWESNYEHGGFGSFYVPCLATDKYLFTWCPVLERGPHCPRPNLELGVQEAQTGKPVGHLKPALEGVLHAINPVIAGGYIFCSDTGGGPYAPLQTHGQMAVATADEKVQLVCRNLIELGTTTSPVFMGERMYLRSPKSLACIAVTTPEGRAYQAMALARTALIALGANPAGPSPRQIEPMAPTAPAPTMPVGKLTDGLATDAWIGAGPFPPGKADEAMLAALRPQAGSEVTIEGKKAAFAALTREQAYNEPPLYTRVFELQGTGDIVPNFLTLVDPRCVSGPQGVGLIYTVLDNTHDRVVVPMLKSPGITMWLGGQLLKADEAVHLKAGLYPLLVRVDPAYYAEPSKAADAPVAVGKALAAKAIDEIGWPGAWQVIGPVPAEASPLGEAQLREVPKTLKIDDQEYTAFEFPANAKNTVLLGSLVDLHPGQVPDVKNPPAAVKIAVPGSAYAFAGLECPSDGYLYVSAAADWYMTWYLDGKSVYDTSAKGNAGAGTDVNAHPFAIRVSKGKHVLAVLVKPGTGGWSFSSIGGFSVKAPEQLAEFKVQARQPVMQRDLRIAPAFKEIPHPPTRLARWLEKLRLAEPRLQAAVRELPGTPEAKAAAALLQELKK